MGEQFPWKPSYSFASVLKAFQLRDFLTIHTSALITTNVTTNRLPSANTCVNALSFPVNTRLQEYNTFSEDMIRCLTECHGFGNV